MSISQNGSGKNTQNTHTGDHDNIFLSSIQAAVQTAQPQEIRTLIAAFKLMVSSPSFIPSPFCTADTLKNAITLLEVQANK
jgi:hypothetical protein